ncbi:Alpha/Beta hydrolase fold [Arabidopsis thaliana x Arabidopsis arenosa]|uniref:Alpha/Beta hydrolase fold n=1 Tax=Arabidopsis thaliana x Arabidopsis arenosa TaxID=1240361 RepID=A0A8T1YYT2_9BRAS|nr:Alpha/Beta hydrolase fold [Arabidopsis thaliana x Arabidopsis arenosa]
MGILKKNTRSDDLSRSGPPQIPSLDWNDLYHRTSLVSCLVQGVYAMERDRKNKRNGSESLATPWWKSFNFTLVESETLYDARDGSIYGAVFQNVINYENTPDSIVPPRYVIALRGTAPTMNDVLHNIRVPFETLNHGGRSKHVIEEIRYFVAKHGNTAVWIAGHSLGAGLALLAGKNMAMSGLPVEAYIFNPPISLMPIEQYGYNHTLNCVYRFTRDIIKAGIAKVLDLDEGQEGPRYKNLVSWRPHLFVNQSDVICSEYIGYFNHVVNMTEAGLGEISRLASGYSVRRMLIGDGENWSSSSSPDHLHFLPSAFMMVNKTESSEFYDNHGIHQWWNHMLKQSATFNSYYSMNYL